MPNWCSNFIEFEGSKKAMKAFRKDVASISDGHCIFTALTDYKEEWDYNNWIKEFGTKWSVMMDDDIRDTLEQNDYFNCETAWSPCIEFVEKVCEKYGIQGRIEYSEGGNDFAGIVLIDEDGYRISEKEMSYMEYQYLECTESFYDDFEMNLKEGFIESEEQIRDEYAFVSNVDMDGLIALFNKIVPSEN